MRNLASKKWLIGGLFMSSLALTGCGDGASQSNFKSLIDAAVAKANPRNSQLADVITLTDVKAQGDFLVLNVSQPTFSYAVLQALVQAGIVKSGVRDGDTIKYAMADKKKAQAATGFNGGQLQVLLGSFKPDAVTNFTKPSDQASNPDSTATVAFKFKPADWLSKDELKTMREWYGLAYQANYHGDNPAEHTPTEAVKMASSIRSIYYDNSKERAAKQQKRIIGQWSSLAVKGLTMNIQMHKGDDGWQVAHPVSGWESTKINSIKPLTQAGLGKASHTIASRMNPDAEKPGKIGKAALDQAFSTADNFGSNLSVNTPFQTSSRMPGLGLMPVRCTAKTSRGWNKINIAYDCSKDDAKQLNQLSSSGLVKRKVLNAGLVTYTATDKMKPLIHNGQLSIGTRKVQQIISQTPGLLWDGRPMVTAKVKAKTAIYDWAQNDAFDTSQVSDGTVKSYRIVVVKNDKQQWREISTSPMVNQLNDNQ